MIATKHKMRATIPCGDPDLGAEFECEITFTFLKGRPADRYEACDPGAPDEIEFVSAEPYCNGKPSPFLDYPDIQQAWLNSLAEDWLQDKGYEEALAVADDDYEAARESAAEYRAELRREDREH